MKSKRRHELQTNTLADQIGHVIERVRPYLTTILAALLGLVAIGAAWYFLASSRGRTQAVAWQAYFNAGSDMQSDMTTDLSAVADAFEGTTAGLWASQSAADLSMAQGMRLLFTDRALAETSLNIARARYREVVESKQARAYPMLLNRARFGLAQTCEALGELDEATKYYQAVADSDTTSAVGKLAAQRIKTLEDPEVVKWYNWFGRQKPTPPAKPPGGAATLPDLGSPTTGLDDLPDLPGEVVPKKPAAGSDTMPGRQPPEKPAPADVTPTAQPPEKPAPADVTPPAATEPPAAASTPSEAGQPPAPAATPEPAPQPKTEPAAKPDGSDPPGE